MKQLQLVVVVDAHEERGEEAGEEEELVDGCEVGVVQVVVVDAPL